uniref:GDSL esterase/lipase n=1 Tax=Oryza glaberrima TaxID=4538 RepID=I1P7X7_ORYGL
MSLADCYSIVMELIEHPQKYGLNRTAFVFWDAYHTSDAANQVIADRLYTDMLTARICKVCPTIYHPYTERKPLFYPTNYHPTPYKQIVR